MRRTEKFGTGGTLVLAVLLGTCLAWADEPGATSGPKPKETAAAKNKRRVVPVRYGSAKELAAALEKFFQGEAEIQAAPDPANNSLLIAATPGVFDEVVATLAQLDRQPQKVIVDVLMAEVVSPHETAAGKTAPEKELSDRDFSGPIEQVTARLEVLDKEKRIANFKQMRVETLENRQGQSQVGEQKPMVNGFHMQGTTGTAVPTFTPRQVGAILQVTPRVVEGNKVLLELVFRNDRIETPEDGIHLADGIDGPLIAGEALNASLTATLTVPVGQAVVVNRVQVDGKSKRTQTRIIVAARIAPESPPSEKE
jgi:type II secretory pathway component GspD/PulD (secretin)